MSQRERRGARRERGSQKGRVSSVVGSTMGEISSRLHGRGLPPGGIRERDGLKVAEGALPDATMLRMADNDNRGRHVLRVVAIVSGSLAALLLVVVLGLTVLSHTSMFTITSISTSGSDHVPAEDVARLAVLDEGATLLNVDASAIEKGVRRNPWVASVEVQRLFPETLRIVVQERSLGALVSMGTGGIAWLLGTDNVWIEPTRVEVQEQESATEAALRKATELGVVLISDVPAGVTPVAGTPASDAAIQAVRAFVDQLSEGFKKDIVSLAAASEDDISCVLTNGVEISFGSPSNISTKESVAQRILDEFSGQVTYINVRVPSHPTYRRVNSTYVREGTGATGSSVDTSNSFAHQVPISEDGEPINPHGQTLVEDGMIDESLDAGTGADGQGSDATGSSADAGSGSSSGTSSSGRSGSAATSSKGSSSSSEYGSSDY